MKSQKTTVSKEVNVFSLSGMAAFKGFLKNGLDSSTMINLIVCFDSKFDEFRQRGFTFPPNLFYYHEISRSEIIGVLINKFSYTVKEAEDSFNKLIQEFNLSKIIRNGITDVTYEQLAQEANERVIKKYKRDDLKISQPDVIIIGGFLRQKVNSVHTGDEGFQKTCEELRLNVMPLPKRDIDKENEIKTWIKKRYRS